MSGGGTRMVSELGAPQAGEGGKAAKQATRRYLALRHKVTLLVSAASLAQHFSTIQAECLKAGCEILSAGRVAEGPDQYAHALLSARVPPAAFGAFFTGIQAHGKLYSHFRPGQPR